MPDKPPEPSTEPVCRCNGTGWVRISIPPHLQDIYSMAEGWAGCNIEAHRMNADEEPPGTST